MLEGMIIGAVVGFAVSMVMLLARRNTRKALLATLARQGTVVAAQLLDRKIPPATKVPLRQIINQRERMAALALLGDKVRLEREIEGHRGALTAVTQVNAIGLLGLTVRSANPKEPAARLDELAKRMEREAGATMNLVKKKTSALATLAEAIATGERIHAQTRMTLDTLAGDGGMVQLLIWQALRQALTASGQGDQAEVFAGKVRQLTEAFEASQASAA